MSGIVKIEALQELPKAFSEKGLYMLATILKTPQATQATISIVETFSKIRELSRSVKELSVIQAHRKEEKAVSMTHDQSSLTPLVTLVIK